MSGVDASEALLSTVEKSVAYDCTGTHLLPWPRLMFSLGVLDMNAITASREIPRREFLRRSTLLAATGTLLGCATSTTLTRPIPAIDTHTHFYDPTRKGGVPWPPPDDSLLYRRVMPTEYKSLAQPLGVKGTVVVEASPLEEDNQWILNLADTDRFILGFVGHLKPGRPNFRKQLDRFGEHPLFKGIRIGGWGVAIEPQSTAYIADLKRLADRHLVVDVIISPDQLPTVAQLAQALPSLRIVINHVANVRINGERPPESWVLGMKACSAHPHVYCKVSALVEGTQKSHQDAPKTVDFYRPVLDAVWEMFGEDRVVYGSNWPVSERFADYATVHRIVENYFLEKGGHIPEKFLRSNAQKIYRLSP